MTLWAQVIGEVLHSSCSMHMQFHSLSDYAESLKFITFVVFLLQVSQHCLGKWTTSAFMQSSATSSLKGLGMLIHLFTWFICDDDVTAAVDHFMECWTKCVHVGREYCLLKS